MPDTPRLYDAAVSVEASGNRNQHPEQALAPLQAQALLAAIVDSSRDAIVSKTLDGVILSWNAAAERLFGYTAAEAVGHSVAALIIPPALQNEEQEILERLARGEVIDHFETVRVAKDGRRIDISLTISPVRDGSGRIVGASKIARDITERRRLERILRDDEQRLRELIEALPAAIYTTDAQGRITHCNSAAVALSGRLPEDEQKPWCMSWKLYRPDGSVLPHEECPMALAVREGRAIRGAEIIVGRPDGHRAWVAAYPTPLRDASGAVTGGINMLVDISDRKRAEEALREETRTAEALNRIGGMLAGQLDIEHILQFVTDEARAVTTAEFAAFFPNAVSEQGEGCAQDTMSGAPAEAFSSFPMPRNTAIFAPTFRGESVIRSDDITQDPRYALNRPYGGVPPAHQPVRSYLAVPVISRSGDVLGGLFFGHGRSGVFTPRHEQIVTSIAAQAAIAIDNASLYARVQESEQRFRQLAEHVTDVFWIMDPVESRMLYVNPAYTEIWGRDCQSLYERPESFLEPIHPRDRERVENAMARQRAGESTAETYRLIHADGSVRWVWDRAFPIRDDAGAVVRVAGIAEDITDRKAAEDRLRESEESYRRLTELLPVAVYACEAPSGIITYYNDRAVALWGRAPNGHDRYCGSLRMFQADGQPISHDECPMARAIETGESFRNVEVVLGRPDGSRIDALVNIEPIRDAEGCVTGAINVCLDVTALKHAEHQLREADRRKDEFLAILSHELRNPLAPLRYALEIIGRSDDDGQRLRESRAVLERQVTHMVRLIDDLLDVSRITHDKLELRRERIEVRSIVREVLDSAHPMIEQAGQTLIVTMPDEPLWLHADLVRMGQVLGNLLSNACKYTPAGGVIRLTVQGRGGQAVLSVEDNGRGIASGELDGIFGLFAQSPSSHREQRGLGVGLTLVKRLVEMHGGSVRAFSEGPGTGSTFTVTLPTSSAGAAQQPVAAAPAEPQAAAGRRVLVVDDNHDAAASLAMLLEMAGHETLTANDGQEAVEAAELFRPHVVLLDLGLPGMDGYEACRAMRRQPGTARATIVAVTGWGQDNDRRLTEEAGFDAHLVKPVEYAAIEQVLRTAG